MDSTDVTEYTVFWGDGTKAVVNADPDPDNAGNFLGKSAHTYASGDYTMLIKDRPDDAGTPNAKLFVYMHSDATTDLTFTTGANKDMVLAGDGNDIINTGADDDWISGGSDDNDTINGGKGNDVVLGDTGNDHLIGGDGNDLVGGGQGGDLISDATGNDSLFGGDGDDKLYGDAGNDLMEGGAGNDKLYGGDGNDWLDGGAGQNQLTGGAGADSFHFTAPVVATATAAAVAAPDKTTITDFSGTGGDNDQIDISDFAAAAGVSELSFIGSDRFHGDSGEVRYAHTGNGNTLVQIDTDGDKHSDYQITLTGLYDLQAGDFVLGHGMMI